MITAGAKQSVIRIAFLLIVWYAMVAVRLFHVHVTLASETSHRYAQRGTRSPHLVGKSQFERARRGDILDARGRVLATGHDTWALLIDPDMEHLPRPGHPRLTLEARVLVLMDALRDIGVPHDPPEFLDRALTRFRRRPHDDGSETMTRLRKRVLLRGLRGHDREYLNCVLRRDRVQNFFFEPEGERAYPQGRVVSEIVGFVGERTEDERSGSDRTLKGRGGVEQLVDGDLAAQHGRWFCSKDGRGVEYDLDAGWEVVPEDGRDIGLTLDLDVQRIVDEELRTLLGPEGLDCRAVCGIVLETQTGRILAMRSLPDASIEEIRAGLVKPEALRCRALQDRYVPGSTFKPFVLARAIESGLVSWNDQFDTGTGQPHRFSLPGGRGSCTVADSGAHGHGVLSARDIIVESSNIGMAMIAFDNMGLEKLIGAAESWGFRKPCGLGFPGEIGGYFATQQSANRLYTATRLAYGHEIALSPMALAAAFSSFGAHGKYHRPRLIEWVGRQEDRRLVGGDARQVLRPDVADQMLEVLGEAVTRGTGRVLAKMPWTAAAKTGTAQVMVRAGESGKYNSSLVAISPMSKPEITVYVGVFDLKGRRYYGGDTAGPAVRNIIERVLPLRGIAPDRR
ncbi:MAG: penicillin-binding protein 2 [Planctomycetes bacterium]|nr:penicillin-binding protein 2 [Planctomycetota bacterium]